MASNSTSDYLPSSEFFIGVIVFKYLFTIVGILGNLGVIIYNILWNHSKLPTDYLIVNLAIIDVITCSTYYPIYAVAFTRFLSGLNENQLLFCKISVTIASTSVALSIMTLLAITVDRFLFMASPLQYPLIVTWCRVYIILLLIWSSAFFYGCLLLVLTKNDEKRFFCSTELPAVVLLGLILSVYIPIIAVVFFNYKIFKMARNQRRRIAEMVTTTSEGVSGSDGNTSRKAGVSRTLKVVKTFVIVIAVFLASLIPYSTAILIEVFICRASCVPLKVFIILGDLVGLNSVANPFIYGIRQKEYRNAFRRMLFKLCGGS